MGAVRVATYNLYLGADLTLLFDLSDLDQLPEVVHAVRNQLERTRFEERARAVAALLARERPDLVGLQEVARWTLATQQPDGSLGPERVLVDFLPTLVAALAAAGCAYDVHAVVASFSGGLSVSEAERINLVVSNAILVRRGVEVMDEQTGCFTDSHDVVTGIDGLSLPILRSWGRVDVRADGAPVRFVNTHLEAWDGAVRGAQRDELLRLNADVNGPVVVVGDLNAAPDDLGMPDGWVDAWTLGTGDGFTSGQAGDLGNEESTLRERIDYVWVRGATGRASRLVGQRSADRTTPHRLWPSDHAGVVADLEV